LNHSLNDNHQLTKLFAQRYQKYQKYFNQDKITTENMFGNDDVSFAIFSSKEGSVGKIIYASKPLMKVLAKATTQSWQ